jgi:hypothetical protein
MKRKEHVSYSVLKHSKKMNIFFEKKILSWSALKTAFNTLFEHFLTTMEANLSKM